MMTFKTKEQAKAKAAQIIAERDWEADSLIVIKAIKALNGVDGWLILDSWNKPL